MKVLLDENLPHELRYLLSAHEVFTVTYMGWDGVKNGDLLALAAANGFEAFVTVDRGMEYEQNSARLPCSVFIVMSPSNRIDDLRRFVPSILISLEVAPKKSFQKVLVDPTF